MQKCLSASALPVPEIYGLKIKVLMMFFFFFPAKSGPTHHGQEVFKSEILSSSAAHIVNGRES